MEIGINKVHGYVEVSFEEAGVRFFSGLLDKQESFEYAERFISAAEDILAICGEDRLAKDLENIREILRG